MDRLCGAGVKSRHFGIVLAVLDPRLNKSLRRVWATGPDTLHPVGDWHDFRAVAVERPGAADWPTIRHLKARGGGGGVRVIRHVHSTVERSRSWCSLA